MAIEKISTTSALVPQELWHGAEDAPRTVDVLTQLAHFLEQIGYTKTVAALQKEASKNDIVIASADWARAIDTKTGVPLLDLYELWQKRKKTLPTLPAADDTSDSEESSDSDDESEQDAAEGALVDVEAEETSNDDSDEKSESDAASSSSDEAEDVEMVDSAVSDKKRKRSPTPASSDDSSSDDSSSDDSDSSSDDNFAPPAKKTKVKASAQSSSSDTSSSDSDASSKSDSDSSDGDSDSSDSSSDSSSESSSESSSDSSSESQAEAPASVKGKKVKKEKKTKTGKEAQAPATADDVAPAKEGSTASSATLEGEDTPNVQESHIHPSRLQQVPSSDPTPVVGSGKKLGGKKEIVPFSRIPVDQKVDPRFASNAYVSYDYADKAHQDLIVTKGKGFTKEKNKKKRGAYRGGAIDLTPKGIKFDD